MEKINKFRYSNTFAQSKIKKDMVLERTFPLAFGLTATVNETLELDM
jgi:hypothetical protein